MPDKKISQLTNLTGANLAADDEFVIVDTSATKTKAITYSELSGAITATIVDSAPTTLDTLNELAAALGDDPNFTTTVTNNIATKVSKSGDTMTGNLSFGDNNKAIFGAGSDLQIYHDGSNSFITDLGTGYLHIRSSTEFKVQNAAGTANHIKAVDSGAVELFYNGASKLATTSTGVDVTGTVNAATLNVDGGTIKLDGNYPVGTNNVALGDAALDSNVSGSENTAIGSQALTAATASNNTAVGYQAGYAVTTGTHNTFVGSGSGDATDDGNRNTALGYLSLSSNAGDNNTAIGTQALILNTGSSNTAVGKDAAFYNTSGNYNTALGESALLNNTTASGNTAVGYQAAYANTTGTRNTALGYQTLIAAAGTNSTRNTAVGYQSLFTVNGGYDNTAVGDTALAALTTGTSNTAVGQESLTRATTSAANTALGYQALSSTTTASYNTAVGHQALYSYVSGSGENVAIGANALYSQTTGYENIGIGRSAGNNITTGVRNTLIGDDAGFYLTTGSKNTIIGRYNGNQGGLDICTSNNNIVLSDGDGNPRGYFNYGGGSNVWVFKASGSNQNNAQFRNTSATNPYGLLIAFDGASPNNTSQYALNFADTTQTRFRVYSNGNVVNVNNSYGAHSDEKLKENIVDASSQWDDIKALTVRKSSLKVDALDAPNKLGVIAQEVEAAGMSGLVFETPDIDPDTKEDLGTVTKQVNYSVLYMKAVKALQEAMERIETLEAKVTTLEAK